MKNKNLLKNIFVILIVLILSSGITYAYIYFGFEGRETNLIKAGCLKVNMMEENNINLTNALPITTREGVRGNPYVYSITNNCTTEAYYETTFNVLTTSGVGNEDKVKIFLDGDTYVEPDFISGFEEVILTEKPNDVRTSYLIDTGYLKVGETKEFFLRAWIDYDVEEFSDPFDFRIILDSTAKEGPSFLSSAIGYRLIDENTIYSGSANYSLIAPITEESNEQVSGLYRTIESTEAYSYYYRGNPINNYVKFGTYAENNVVTYTGLDGNQVTVEHQKGDDIMWRIVGVNSDGTIKLVLEDFIGTSSFNTVGSDSKYTGYQYDQTSSTIKQALEEWYNKHLISNDDFVATYNFCSDQTTTTSGEKIYYGGYERNVNKKDPSSVCDTANTVSSKIGLLTVDDIAKAGGLYNTANTSYYLKKNISGWWTMSPAVYENGIAKNFISSNNSSINYSDVTVKAGVRPVVNIANNYVLIGEGTSSNPYEIREKIVDTINPIITTMYVGGSTNPLYTGNRSASIYMDWEDTDVTAYCFSNTSGCTNWVEIAAGTTTITANHTLTSGSGTKTVNAWIRDKAGNISALKSDTIILDITDPTITYVYSGGMVYTDPNFSSGNNSTYVYNWYETNGTVTNERVAMTTPVGNYALKITTTGSAGPGLGGFRYGTPTTANKVMVSRIIAQIPVGYSIEWNTNSIGDDRTNAWLTDTAGTGDWQEYVHVAIAGSTGTFSSTNYYYLKGTAATAENPVTWYVAYTTVYSNQDDYSKAGISFKADDSESGIIAYGINKSSTTEPTYTTVSSTNTIGRVLENISENGTYYVWVKDAVGNVSNTAITVSNVNTTAPTVATMYVGGSTNPAYTNSTSTTVYATWNATDVTAYCVSNTATCSSWTTITEGTTSVTPSHTLTSGDGSKTVYFWLRDKAGNISALKSDTIILDTTAPTVTTMYAGGSSNPVSITTTSTTVYATWSATDVTAYCVSNTATCSSWTTITAGTTSVTPSHTITSGDGTKTIYFWIRDRVGNVSAVKTDTINLDTTAPTVTTASTVATAQVTINATLKDNIGVTGWQVTTSATAPTSGWEAITSTTSVVKSFTRNATGTYYVWTRDAAGNTGYKAVTLGLTAWSSYGTTSCSTSNSLVCQSAAYYLKQTQTVSTEYGAWSAYTTTACSGSSDVCRTTTMASTRSYSSAGHYTYNYCPNGSDAFQDRSYQYGSYCSWRRWKKACDRNPPSGYRSCPTGTIYTYSTSQSTSCVTGTGTCITYSGSYVTVSIPATYNSSLSGWEYTTSSTTTTSCGSYSGYALSSREATYRCYNYGSWGSYAAGTCSSTACLNGYGTCCRTTTGYSTRTATQVYSGWSSGEYVTSCTNVTNLTKCTATTLYRTRTFTVS